MVFENLDFLFISLVGFTFHGTLLYKVIYLNVVSFPYFVSYFCTYITNSSLMRNCRTKKGKVYF